MEPVVIEFVERDGSVLAEMGRTIDDVMKDVGHGTPIERRNVVSHRVVPLAEAQQKYAEWYQKAYDCVTNLEKQPMYFLGSPKK